MFTILIHFACLIIIQLCASEAEIKPIKSYPTVSIPDGKIQGDYSTSYRGKPYIQFVGIPYAAPPIGNLRFEDPIPVMPWKGTWIANVSSICTQVYHWFEPEGGLSMGQEDCLHLNVFVPGNKINPNAKHDVNIHIHGGALMFGSREAYAGPKFLMDRNDIIVIMNYRIGVLGFLSTGDANLPGNYGMKDQILAMKWVQKNIHHFGGNPNSVTLSGLSAGGASVHYHYLSPLSRGLFNAGISASGCALNPWAINEKPIKQAKIIGKAVGCDMENTEELTSCLKTRKVEQLNEATRKLRPWLFNPFSPIGVVIDTASKSPFLPENPYKLMKDGLIYDVPWIISATTAEGTYPGADFRVKENYLDYLDKNWDQLAPEILHYKETLAQDLMQNISRKVRKYYLGDSKISKKSFNELIQLLSDRLFLADIEIAARLQAKANKSPVYFYLFDYLGDKVLPLSERFTGLPEKFGVGHGNDMMYIFSDTRYKEVANLTKNDEKMMDALIGIWLTFGQNKQPLDNWTPVSKNYNYPIDFLLVKSGDELEMKSAYELGNRKYWENLPFKENANLFR